MRKFAQIRPAFWTGESGRDICRRGPEAVIVAMYLMTSPDSNLIGLYNYGEPIIAHHTRLTLEGVSKGLRELEEAGFIVLDRDRELVWVKEMARYQVAAELKPKNNGKKSDLRIPAVVSELVKHHKSPLFLAFFERYGESYRLSEILPADVLPGPFQGATRAPSVAPSESLRSKEKENENEKKKENETENSFSPASQAKTAKKRDVDNDVVGEIYQAYPKHVGKAAALKSIKKAIATIGARPLPAGATPATWLLDRTQTYALKRQEVVGADPSQAQFTPHPSTWFNEGRFDDDQSNWTQLPVRSSNVINRPTAAERGEYSEDLQLDPRVLGGNTRANAA